MLRGALAGILALALAACGGRSFHPGNSGPGGNNATNSNHNNSGPINDATVPIDAIVFPDAGTGSCGFPEQCVVAIRTDNCCTAAFPTLLSRVQSDFCLELWPPSWSAIPQQCLDAWDPECANIDCDPGAPQSRVAFCGSDGNTCEYLPECLNEADCSLALDYGLCCPCPEAVPTGLINIDPCLVPDGGGPPGPECPPLACPDIPCPPCADDPPNCDFDRRICWNDNSGGF